MSSSIAIPQRKKKMLSDSHVASSASSSSSSYGSFVDTSRTPQASSSVLTPSARYYHDRRPSLLSSSISKTEHIVINVGNSDSPRLITCVKASQGFDWNQDIFLPSYTDHDSGDLERKQDPVEDIILTDEEIASMFPQ
ncbi:uncharacterized protein K441DRAFT_660132 [Cenococcum geophilum 1.58]|uniref:uncharacterized protein n=1 Tax=Cenococcum geophilum 1.58 TaxID=794803 RepID=UPI00358F862D|nr:hypothetical protein K441DRAFT_660132 [Cenococcum geophilum 1.58]